MRTLILLAFIICAKVSASSFIMTPNGVLVLNGVTLTKYLKNEKLDPSFNKGGVYSIIGFKQVNTISIQKDNKVLIGGQDLVDGFRLLRLNNNGSVDNTFGTNGVVKTDFKSMTGEMVQSIAVQEDEKIIVVGHGTVVASRSIAIARYTTKGVLDTTFNKTGLYTNNGQGYAMSVTVQPDGKILVGGQTSNKISVMRFNANGTLEFTKIGNKLGLVNSVKEKDGKIVAVGQVISGVGMRMFSAKFLSDGAPDLSFNKTGYREFAIGSHNSYALDLDIQDDEKIVIVGQSDIGEGTKRSPIHFNVTAVRLTEFGELDTTFNKTGILIKDYGYTSALDSAFAKSNEVTMYGKAKQNNKTLLITIKHP